MRESASRYSTVSIILHWLIAALLIWNVVVGGRMEDVEGDAKLAALGWHKSIGVTIFLLTVLRLAWRLAHPWPPLPDNMAGWERFLARGTHAGFYVLLLVIPLFGWATVSAAGAPELPLWSLIPWPNLPLPRSEDLADALGETHETLVKLTYLVIALHIAGALKHHFINKDVVLHRMLPLVGRGRPAG